MRKVILFLVLLVSLKSIGQGNSFNPNARLNVGLAGIIRFSGDSWYYGNPTNYLYRATRERLISAMYDSMLRIPRYNGTPSGVRVGETADIDGAIAMDTTNHRLYIFSGNAWVRLAKYTEITTPTWQQTLTAGSTLTTNNTIDGASKTLLFDNNASFTAKSVGLGTSTQTYLSSSNGLASSNFNIAVIEALGSFHGSVTGHSYVDSSIALIGATHYNDNSNLIVEPKRIAAYTDTFQLKLHGVNYFKIDSLNAFSDTTNWKPMVYKTSTGEVKKATYWPSEITAASTTTFTNKRWVARVGSTTSSATPTINTDNYDIYKLTAQAADITSFTSNLSGSPNDGDILEIQITGTATRNLTFGSAFVSSTVTIPSATSGTATLSIIFQYYTTSSYGNNKWVCVNYY